MNIKDIREYLSDEDIQALLNQHYNNIETFEINDKFIGIWGKDGIIINWCSGGMENEMFDLLLIEAQRIIRERNLKIILDNHERNSRKNK